MAYPKFLVSQRLESLFFYKECSENSEL